MVSIAPFPIVARRTVLVVAVRVLRPRAVSLRPWNQPSVVGKRPQAFPYPCSSMIVSTDEPKEEDEEDHGHDNPFDIVAGRCPPPIIVPVNDDVLPLLHDVI